MASGADEVADVVMELRYKGMFGKDAGIYQRLAVGENAVGQPGAALMFARAGDGSISTNAAAAIIGLGTIPKETDQTRLTKIQIINYHASNEGDRAKVVAIIHEVLDVDWNGFLENEFTEEQLKQLQEKLKSKNIVIGEK